MTWIPDIPPLFSAIKRIEDEEDLLKDSTEMFWLFCNGIMNPDQFVERMDFWRKMVEKDKPEGGGFNISELESIMDEGFKNPDSAVNIILEKFDSLIEAKSVQYIPDSNEPPIPLFVNLHLEAARLIRVIKVQGYSDITRESVAKALSVINRCYIALRNHPELLWPWEYSISLEAVGSFLYTMHFFMLKTDGKYEDALISLLKGLDHIQESHSIFVNNRRPIFKSGLHFYHINFSNDLRYNAPWIVDLNQQLFVDCFEAIRKGHQINDTQKLVDICESFINYSDEPWLSNSRPSNTGTLYWPELAKHEISNNVETEEYEYEHAADYWYESLGWVEAQISQSEFKKIISEREEEAAIQRLQRYFFKENIWRKIPERARRCLVTADRDWFSGSAIRTEAVFSNLSIATEEILFFGLWKKLEKWLASQPDTIQEERLFSLKDKLADRSKSSRLRILADICKEKVTERYLEYRGYSPYEITWLTESLPAKIHELYNKRNLAEHESEIRWAPAEIAHYYRRFMGIGQYGIIPSLCALLLETD